MSEKLVASVMRILPLFVLFAGVISTFTITQFQVKANAEEIEDLSEGQDETEEEVEQIQRILIEQAGDQALEIQQLRGDVQLILRLLQDDQ